MDAKSKGGNVKMRPGWNNMKVDVMLTVVRSKFSRDEDLQQKLLATRSQKIVEGHTGDKFWGGKANHLGNILMRVRDEVQILVPAAPTLLEAGSANAKPRHKGDSNRQALFQSHMEMWLHVD